MKLCECGCGEPTRLATKTDRRAGQTRGKPLRFLVGHNLRLVAKPTPVPPSWGAEDRGYITPCWIWTGPMMTTGYGEIRNPVRQLAHRWAYETWIGLIPEGQEVHHLCEVRNCVNPEHLAVLSHAAHTSLHQAKAKQRDPEGYHAMKVRAGRANG